MVFLAGEFFTHGRRAQRYSDGESFSKSWLYAAMQIMGKGKLLFIYNTDSPFAEAGPPETTSQILFLTDVMPFINSRDHWRDAVVGFDFKTGKITDVH